ncbi:MAG: transglutaminase domain-containing protein [Lachnospiraceae bacterium]|nr:transglutaminase domain-containing protein [Lachnospiraceae bacterium]
MNKRIISVLLCIAMVAALIGCGKKQEAADDLLKQAMVKNGLAEEEEEGSSKSNKKGTGDAGKYVITELNSGGSVLTSDMLATSGMDDTYLLLNEDHTGTLHLAGNDTEITWDEKGNIGAFGQNLYTFKREGDTVTLDMMGSIYTFARAEDGSGKAAAGGKKKKGDDKAGSEEAAYSKQPNRHLMSTETEYPVDGGVLYYEKDPDGIAISYGNVYADELRIPDEIEGQPVYAIRRLHGYIKNLYLPKTLKTIYASFGDFEGCEKLVIGDGSDSCDLDYFSQGGCQYGHFIKYDLKEISFPKSMKTNEDIKLKLNVMGGAFHLEKASNLPPIWQEGYDSLTKAEKMLKDPKKAIQKPSKKVQQLTEQVTQGADSDEEKLYRICEWICDNVSYDIVGYINWQAKRQAEYYGGEADEKTADKITQWLDPDDVIDNKVTVCEGYARLTKAMCNAAGIPAVNVFGILPPKKDLQEYHAWNMVYVNGAWTHIDNTASDKDYNSSIVYDDEGELYAVETNEGGNSITYEMYMSNEELQEDYTWEEIEAINQATADKYSFKNAHDYYCLTALAMGSNHIAWEIDGTPIQ